MPSDVAPRAAPRPAALILRATIACLEGAMNPSVFRLAAALAAATLLSACSGTPDGSGAQVESSSDSQGQPIRVGPIELRVPDGWENDPEAASRGEEASYRPPTPDGQVAPQALVMVLDTAAGDAQVVSRLHTASTQAIFPGIELAPRRDVDVPGARGAVRLDWFLPARGADRPAGSFYDLVIVTDDGQEVLVRLATRDP